MNSTATTFENKKKQSCWASRKFFLSTSSRLFCLTSWVWAAGCPPCSLLCCGCFSFCGVELSALLCVFSGLLIALHLQCLPLACSLFHDLELHLKAREGISNTVERRRVHSALRAGMRQRRSSSHSDVEWVSDAEIRGTAWGVQVFVTT